MDPARSTLHHVTERKLSKLDQHREQFKADRKAILDSAALASDPIHEVEALLEGFERYAIVPTQPDLDLKNLKRFIRQAKHDPSVTPSLLRSWKTQLEHELDVTGVKYDYAALFGRLVSDWIKHSNTVPPKSSGSTAADDAELEKGKPSGMVGRKEMHEQREMWESIVFTKRPVDQNKIEAYLNDIFDTANETKAKKSPLQILRDAMKNVMDFRSDLKTPISEDDPDEDSPATKAPREVRFTLETLKSSINGVISSDLLAPAKCRGLKALRNEPAVLDELVDVLNMDLDGLDQWKWEPSPVSLAMRRQLNGKYRVFMDPESHQAILLHFIGNTWAVALKKAFTTFYHSPAWVQEPHRAMDRKARDRREHFLLHEYAKASKSIRDCRREAFEETYFMTQLPNNSKDTSSYDDSNAGSDTNGAQLNTKQSLLRLVTTEMLLNSKIYGEFLVLQTDFKWFGPSLPHETIFTVLRFLGVPEKWVRFFKTFLEAPVVFSQDGPGAQVRTRACGVPMSLVMSDALSEAVLFCLDFAINKRTKGSNLYRFHDDLWFWGQESTCIEGWSALQEFSSVMGLTLNEEKTGAALVVANKTTPRPVPAALPQQKIKWGFLTLDPTVGAWRVNQDKIDEHVEELRRQLSACRSVLAWVQAWNSYANRFFYANLAPPASCLAKPHNEMIIKTFEQVQHKLFAESGAANVTDHLRTMLKDRLGTDDSIPNGFFYFPEQLGGLGVRNPLITALATYKNSPRTPGLSIDRVLDGEKEAYDQCKEAYESGKHVRHNRAVNLGINPPVAPGEPFMSFEEFTSYREEVSQPLMMAYKSLMMSPRFDSVKTPAALHAALCAANFTPSSSEFDYWEWICVLYEGEIKQRFGGDGVQLGERSSLPTRLMDILKKEKVQWEG